MAAAKPCSWRRGCVGAPRCTSPVRCKEKKNVQTESYRLGRVAGPGPVIVECACGARANRPDQHRAVDRRLSGVVPGHHRTHPRVLRYPQSGRARRLVPADAGRRERRAGEFSCQLLRRALLVRRRCRDDDRDGRQGAAGAGGGGGVRRGRDAGRADRVLAHPSRAQFRSGHRRLSHHPPVWREDPPRRGGRADLFHRRRGDQLRGRAVRLRHAIGVGPLPAAGRSPPAEPSFPRCRGPCQASSTSPTRRAAGR